MRPLAAALQRGWRSVGLRIVLLFLLLALAIVLVGASGMQRAMGGSWRALVRPLVADYGDRLAAEIGSPPDVARARALVERLPLTVRISGPHVQWDSHAALDGDAAAPGRGQEGLAAGADAERRERRAERMAERQRDMLARGSSWPMGPGMHRPPHLDGDAEPGPADTERGWFTLARPTADGHLIQFGLGQVPWRSRPRAIGWFTVALLAVLTLVAYAVVRHWLRPLRDIGAGALRYGQGEFGEAIPVRRPDELGELAAQINTMASRLHGMLEAKRALLLAISHELRSPLTRARLNAELVDEGASRDALLRDLGEMRDLISDLLESERLAAGHQALQREPTDLAALLRSVCAELAPVAAAGGDGAADGAAGGAGARISLALDEAVGVVPVDPMRWRVLVRNLVGNALRHGRPDAAVEAGPGPVADIELRLTRLGSQLSLSVRDHGPGVPPEQLARLTEAFYRPDSDRGRRSGGVGLGLHLCRLIAEAHGGQLTLSAARPGLLATVVWPAEPMSAEPLR